ncbi:hypothetical protein ACQKJC_24705 [Priestia koreensis]|uniref:hypothetical protein n=1 Tax=Priestia koreensis TaxID=284581 RepID=UPI003D04B586
MEELNFKVTHHSYGEINFVVVNEENNSDVNLAARGHYFDDKEQRVLYGFSINVMEDYQGTKAVEELFKWFTDSYKDQYKGYSFYYEYGNERMDKLIQRRVKQGKLPKEVVSKRLNNYLIEKEHREMKLRRKKANLNIKKLYALRNASFLEGKSIDKELSNVENEIKKLHNHKSIFTKSELIKHIEETSQETFKNRLLPLNDAISVINKVFSDNLVFHHTGIVGGEGILRNGKIKTSPNYSEYKEMADQLTTFNFHSAKLIEEYSRLKEIGEDEKATEILNEVDNLTGRLNLTNRLLEMEDNKKERLYMTKEYDFFTTETGLIIGFTNVFKRGIVTFVFDEKDLNLFSNYIFSDSRFEGRYVAPEKIVMDVAAELTSYNVDFSMSAEYLGFEEILLSKLKYVVYINTDSINIFSKDGDLYKYVPLESLLQGQKLR